MRTGRPSNRKRPAFGQRLHDLREKAGLTQAQIAQQLDITPRAYAFWERERVALKTEQLAALAKIFAVSADVLIGQEQPKTRKGGPVGKAQRVFEQVSQLPRSRQRRILGVVEDMLTAQRLQSDKQGG